MTNGIAVLGLDALDTRLVDRLDCKNLQLDRSAKLETFSYATEHPKTSEVWPTIATGVHPREHGLDEEHNRYFPNESRERCLNATKQSLSV